MKNFPSIDHLWVSFSAFFLLQPITTTPVKASPVESEKDYVDFAAILKKILIIRVSNLETLERMCVCFKLWDNFNECPALTGWLILHQNK